MNKRETIKTIREQIRCSIFQKWLRRNYRLLCRELVKTAEILNADIDKPLSAARSHYSDIYSGSIRPVIETFVKTMGRYENAIWIEEAYDNLCGLYAAPDACYAIRLEKYGWDDCTAQFCGPWYIPWNDYLKHYTMKEFRKLLMSTKKGNK